MPSSRTSHEPVPSPSRVDRTSSTIQRSCGSRRSRGNDPNTLSPSSRRPSLKRALEACAGLGDERVDRLAGRENSIAPLVIKTLARINSDVLAHGSTLVWYSDASAEGGTHGQGRTARTDRPPGQARSQAPGDHHDPGPAGGVGAGGGGAARRGAREHLAMEPPAAAGRRLGRRVRAWAAG